MREFIIWDELPDYRISSGFHQELFILEFKTKAKSSALNGSEFAQNSNFDRIIPALFLHYFCYFSTFMKPNTHS